MYANGDGGPKDIKKALDLWIAAEKAGDPLVSILVADQLFANISGGRKPGPGTYEFRGAISVKEDIEVAEEWYRQARKRDSRPEVQKRADYALTVLGSFKTAATSGKVAKAKR